MGLAEIHAAKSHGVTDRPVIAGQFRSRLDIHRSHIVAEGHTQRACIRRLRMIEVTSIVAAQDPQFKVAVQR